MMSGLRVAFLLLLVTGTTVQGSDLSDARNDNDPGPAAAALRLKRWSGVSLFDSLRGKGAATQPKPAKPTAGGDGFGFDLSDALHPDPKPSKPAGGGFSLDDALRPAVKPTVNPSGGDCQGTLVQKLSAVMENQKQQLRLLQQLTARYTSRFDRPMR